MSACSTDSQRSRTSWFSGRVVLAIDVLARQLEVLPLELERRHRPAVGELHLDAEGHIARHVVQRRDRVHEGEVGQEAVLDHLQHDRGRAELQELRDLAEVRVADDHVQAPVLLGVRVRLVTGVDDRSLQRRLQSDLGLEEVGALGELERVTAAIVPGGLEAHLAGAGEHLPGDEERRQIPDDVGERGGAIHQVVLVGAVGVALAVGVVLVDRERRGRRHLLRHHLERALEDPLPRLVVDHERARRQALGRGVLGMGVIDVVASSVGEDHVREPEILVGDLPGGRGLEPAGVTQRRFVLVVPADPPQAAGVGRDQQRRRKHRVEVRLADRGDAVLRLGSDDLRDGHGPTLPGPAG